MNPVVVYALYLALLIGVAGLGFLAARSLSTCFRYTAWALLALTVMVFMVRVSEPRPPFLLSDFISAYYPAGQRILHDPYRMYGQMELQFVNIPIIALLFTPLSSRSLHDAKIVSTLLGIGSSAAACWMLIGLMGATGYKRLAVIGLFLFKGPLYYSLRESNLTHFVLLLLVAALLCINRNREVGVGILLTVAGLIKLPLCLLGFYLCLLSFGATLLATGAASVLLFGMDLNRCWLEQSAKPFTSSPLVAFNVQSTSGLLARALTKADMDSSRRGSLRSWRPMPMGWSFTVLHHALLSLLAGTTLWVFWRSRLARSTAGEHVEFYLFLCLARITSPISWSHYYLFLLVPMALLVAHGFESQHSAGWYLLVGMILCAISLPVVSIESQAPWVRLMVSHYVMGGMALLAMLLHWRLDMHRVETRTLVAISQHSRMAYAARRSA